MSMFGLGLSLLVVVATAMVLLPLARQQGISQRLLLAVGVIVPMFSMSLYVLLGNPQAISRHVSPSNQTAEMLTLIEKLEQRLKKSPNDTDGWILLGNTYVTNTQLDRAVDAFSHAHQLLPEDIGVLLSLLDTQVTLDHGLVSHHSDVWIEKLLLLEPDNSLALWFAGLSAKQKGDMKTAKGYFQRLKDSLPENAPNSHRIINMLDSVSH